MRVSLKSPIESLAGIGVKKAELFSSLGMKTVGDLLYRFPRAYQNRSDIKTLAEAAILGETCAMLLTVGSQPSNAVLRGRMTLTKFSAFDESGKCTVVFFNQSYIKEVFTLGATYRFWGKLTKNKNRWELTSPQFEPVTGNTPLPDYTAVYPLGRGVGQKLMRKTVETALKTAEVFDILPEEIRKRNSLESLRKALYDIHCPDSPASLERARKYFIFEELFLFALSVASAKRARTGRVGIKITLEKSEWARFLSSLPFELTDAQKRVVGEIFSDLSSGSVMHRLVGGDVGSGKTVCAAAAAYAVIKSGYQAAMMAPTEILARQHYNDLSPLFASLGIKTELLVGSLSAKEKARVHLLASEGEADFLIGTHALIQEAVLFKRPALMITDEQHRFGIRQRAMLAEKGESLHTLVMSATPIPRTLALALYGDLDISAVDTLPPNRKKVSTFLVDESYRERLTGFIKKQADEGRQVYIVCPAIEEDNGDDDDDEVTSSLVDIYGNLIEKPKLKHAVEYARELASLLPTVKVGCLHGRMSADEKERVMARFEKGELSVLVSTTVIEVGVNIPNATLMVVENAERFGLSQLHQLRGRVGRGAFKSWCILVSDSKKDESLKRMNALSQTNDGYKIAEYDLEMRGPGDFVASSTDTRQHGEMKFSLASISENTELFTKAFAEAQRLIFEDRYLEKEENRGIRGAVNFLEEKGATTLS